MGKFQTLYSKTIFFLGSGCVDIDWVKIMGWHNLQVFEALPLCLFLFFLAKNIDTLALKRLHLNCSNSSDLLDFNVQMSILKQVIGHFMIFWELVSFKHEKNVTVVLVDNQFLSSYIQILSNTGGLLSTLIFFKVAFFWVCQTGSRRNLDSGLNTEILCTASHFISLPDEEFWAGLKIICYFVNIRYPDKIISLEMDYRKTLVCFFLLIFENRSL